jgi:hypothetical protein
MPVQGDYDGDAKIDYAVYRGGVWHIHNSSDNSLATKSWGAATDTPIVGDFDGDGRADLTVYRSGTWHILVTLTGNQRTVRFGAAGDIPISGDFDGDGTSDIAVFRPSDGIWYIINSSDGSFRGVKMGTTSRYSNSG